MSSLSRQLQSLRVPQTSAHRQTKRSASFLYEFSEAKSIDNDTHYAIAVNGLLCLSQHQPSIMRFKQTLFSESSKTLDRAVQSEETNADLDDEIEAFLFGVVSNYFLLKATHQTIEWLIHRYQVNRYNVDSFIACVLPYHETRLFARLLQTCSADKAVENNWSFLKPLQKTGSPLLKSSLIAHCVSNHGLIRIICDTTLRSLKINAKSDPFISFFVSTLINIIEKDSSQGIIAVIISYLIKGVKQSKIDSFKIGSYCVTAHLCTRVNLEANVMLKIVKAISKRPKICNELIITLTIIASNQMLEGLPTILINNLSVEMLVNSAKEWNIDALICIILKTCISNIEDIQMKAKLIEMLNQLDLSSSATYICVQTIADKLIDINDEITVIAFSEVLSILERRFPTYFDESLFKLDSISIIVPLLGAFRFSLVKDTGVPLIVGLKHSNESVREAALHHVIMNFDILLVQNDLAMISSIKDMITDCCVKNNFDLLISLFGLKERMFRLFNEEEMHKICANILTVCQSKENNSDEDSVNWYQLRNSVLATYCSILNPDKSFFISLIYPYLMPSSDRDLDTLAIILDSKSANNIEILRLLWEKCRIVIENSSDERNMQSIVSIICQEIANYYILSNDLIFENILRSNIADFANNIKIHMFNILIIERIFSLSPELYIKNKCGNIFIEILKHSIESKNVKSKSKSYENYNEFLHDCIKCVKFNRIRLSIFDFAIKSLINGNDFSVNKSSAITSWYWHKELINNNNFYVNLCIILIKYSIDKHHRKLKTFRQLFFIFAKTICSNVGVEFFSAFWSNSDDTFMQIRSLVIAINLNCNVLTLNKFSKLSLLISLTSSVNTVREIAVKLIRIINESNNEQLLTLCLANSREIENDENEISNIIATWFDSLSKSSAKKQFTDINLQIKDWLSYLDDENTPDYIKLGILQLLKRNVNFSQKMLNSMSNYLYISSPNKVQQKIVEIVILTYNDVDVWLKIDSVNHFFITYFLKLFQTDYKNLAINCLNRVQFEKLSKSVQMLLLKELLCMVFSHNNKIAKKKFKTLLNDGQTIIDLLEYYVPINPSSDSSKATKRRRTIDQTNILLESSEWKTFMIILETINSKKNIVNSSVLVNSLLNYLKITFIVNVNSSLEYLRQLILTSLINLIEDIDHNDSGVNNFQIDCVIECLRESHQKETQRKALQLISNISLKFKKETLDYFMSIFTFIGNNLLHCDDQYTIRIIHDSMESIIPNLLIEEKDTVINVFIDSLVDIPSHRRLPLFSKLLSMLGKETHLRILLLKIVEKTLHKTKIERQPFINLAVALCSQCDISSQCDSLNDLIHVLSDILDKKTINVNKKTKLSENDQSVMSQNLVYIVFQVVSSQEFCQTISSINWDDISKSLLTLLHSLITMIEKCTTSENNVLVIETNNFKKRLLHYLQQILLKINSLLPDQQVIELVIQLMQNNSLIIQRRALEMLNEKLENLSKHSREELNEKQLISLMKILIKQLPSIELVNQLNESQVYNTQLLMIALKLLSKLISISESNSQYLQKIIQELIKLIKMMKVDISANFKASCILCLTQMMVSLSHNAIPLLPSVMPIILDNFMINNEVIIISNITALSKMAQHFAQFLSPYLEIIIVKVFTASNKFSQSIGLRNRLKLIWTSFAKNITKHIFFNSLDSSFTEVSSLSPDSICEFMDLVKFTLETVQKDEIKSINKYFKSLMIKTLDYRNINEKCLDLAVIEKVENRSIEAFCALVPKMTEITFRPLFYKLYDWAVREKQSTLYQRIITFYNLSQSLADKLKNLFCIFVAPSIVSNCCQMLTFFHESNNRDGQTFQDDTAHTLICSILSTLYKCFMYDTNNAFLNKERITALMKPILDQLTNTIGNLNEYQTRIELICLCIQYIKTNDIIKDINYQILLKTRESSSTIRWGALKALHRLISVSSEDYLSLIPEVIPFISELSEDDSKEIENLIQIVIKDLELILGEPISKYF